jgi:hypothetical protein
VLARQGILNVNALRAGMHPMGAQDIHLFAGEVMAAELQALQVGPAGCLHQFLQKISVHAVLQADAEALEGLQKGQGGQQVQVFGLVLLQAFDGGFGFFVQCRMHEEFDAF